MPDGWELTYGLNPRDATGNNGASGDPDGDGRTNTQEFAAGTNPVVPDTQRIYLPFVAKASGR